MNRFVRLTWWACVVVFVALPAIGIVQFAFQHYDAAASAYRWQTPSLSRVFGFITGPHAQLIASLLGRGIAISLITAAYAFVLIFIAVALRSPSALTAFVGLSTAAFFVPVLVRAYAWESLMANLVPRSEVALYMFYALSLSVFFVAGFVVRIGEDYQSVLYSIAEYTRRGRRLGAVYSLYVGPAVFGLVSVFCIFVFSGAEVRRFGTNIYYMNQIMSDLHGERLDELALWAGIAFLMSVMAATFAARVVNRFWSFHP